MSNIPPRRTGPGDTGKFQSRRSVARARASKEKIAREAQIQRNLQRQAHTQRSLRRAALALGGIGFIAILFYVFWWAPQHSNQDLRDGIDITLPAQR